MIVFTDVSKSFDRRTIMDKVNVSINPGEFVCITGPSGAGKSTFVHMLIRAEVPSRGKIEIDGVNLATLSPSILQLLRRRMGVLFQDYKLLADRTVEENISFALEVCGEPDAVIRKRVPELLKRVGLTGRENAFPRELSGGERARTGLARALVHKPMIVIADEPTGNIDPKQSLELLGMLKQIHAEGTTVILATHDQTLVDALQTRVLRLEKGIIVRDSVGGYVTGTSTKKSDMRSHDIFGRSQVVSRPNSPQKSIKPSMEKEETTEKTADVPVQEKKKDEPSDKDKPSTSGKIKPIAI